jgi:hypothetical protein
MRSNWKLPITNISNEIERPDFDRFPESSLESIASINISCVYLTGSSSGRLFQTNVHSPSHLSALINTIKET